MAASQGIEWLLVKGFKRRLVKGSSGGKSRDGGVGRQGKEGLLVKGSSSCQAMA